MGERKPRSDKGTFQFKPRDVQALTWIGQMYAVRFDILRRILSRELDEQQRERAYKHHLEKAQEAGKQLDIPTDTLLAESTVYQILRRWKEAELVTTSKLDGNNPIYIWLTQKGIDSVGLPYRFHTPSLSLIKHIHAVTKVRVRLEEMHSDGEWISEREITRRINRLKEEERKKIDHLPDAEMQFPDGRQFVIEVELSPKPDKRIASILWGLRERYALEHNKNVQILYFVNDVTKAAIERIGLTNTQPGAKPYFTKEELRILTLKEGYD